MGTDMKQYQAGFDKVVEYYLDLQEEATRKWPYGCGHKWRISFVAEFFPFSSRRLAEEGKPDLHGMRAECDEVAMLLDVVKDDYSDLFTALEEVASFHPREWDNLLYNTAREWGMEWNF